MAGREGTRVERNPRPRKQDCYQGVGFGCGGSRLRPIVVVSEAPRESRGSGRGTVRRSPSSAGGLAGQVALKRKNRRIYGRVQDEVSGDAIVGAEVRVAGVSVVTDSLGLFEVNIPGELIQPELDCDVIAPSYLAGHFRVVPNSNEAVLPLKRGR